MFTNIFHTNCTIYIIQGVHCTKYAKKYVNDTEIISFYLGGWGMTLRVVCRYPGFGTRAICTIFR